MRVLRVLFTLASLALAVPAIGDEPSPLERLDELRRSHWAFRAIGRPRPPEVEDASWVRGDIDRFVLARLEASGTTPSPPASRRTLIRRAFVDLIGLPPTADEVRAFEEDSSPGAFAAIVDRLLARREYGERWGRRWLDVARYADTKGYVDAGEQRYPFAWTYRDWVIGAFNDDLPFDRFILEQLAADRLVERGEASPESLAALGFLTVGQRFNFFPHEILDDRIDVVTRGFMGLTATCARCHDHKYDPISAADYYALYGVFASSREPSPDAYPVLARADKAGDVDADAGEEFARKLREKAAAYEERRRELHRQIQHELRAWAGDYLRYIVQLMPAHRTEAQPPLRTERGLLREMTAYGRGGVVRWRRFIESRGADDRVFGLWNRLLRLERDEIPARAPAMIAELRERDAINPVLAAALEKSPPRTMVDVASAYGRVLEETDELWRVALERDASLQALDDGAREELREVLYGRDAPASMTLDDSEDLYQLDEHTDVRKRFADIERVFLKADRAAPRAMVLVDRERPVEQRVFLRGDPVTPGERVDPRLPRLLAHVREEPFEDGSGRLELARALVDRRNPLTARVIVNRVWAWHFGEGLVRTPSDFGVRGDPPSHPELLDWLASWFVDGGWSLKRLHRLILLSSAWQQSSDDRPECRRVDPDNRLLWRQNRRRLDFESMRDSMLRVAGRLEQRAGGRPIRVAPDDPASRARTVYLLLDREKLPSVFRVFDFPSPDISSPERPRTTVPQQALFLLNSPFVIAQAEAIASAVEAAYGDGQEGDGAGVAERVRSVYRRVLQREPDAAEIDLAAEVVAQPVREVASEPPSPWRYGFGAYDEERERVASFTPLPHFNGSAWQGGPAWPDPALSHLRLTATGGHVGIDREHAAIRRWVAPRDGRVSIDGTLAHGEEDCGDGVRGRIVSSVHGELGRFEVYKQRVETTVDAVDVTAGDTIDFIADCRDNHFCDLFDWAPVVRQHPAGASDTPIEWNAERDFGGAGGARQPELSPVARLAQVLLQSNEFLFVD